MPVLLAAGKPGSPIRLRLSVFAGLINLHEFVQQDHAVELTALARSGLDDTYIPLQQLAQELVASFHLSEFNPELEEEAHQAPSGWQRQVAQSALDQLLSGNRPPAGGGGG